jgi:hypothetical protein
MGESSFTLAAPKRGGAEIRPEPANRAIRAGAKPRRCRNGAVELRGERVHEVRHPLQLREQRPRVAAAALAERRGETHEERAGRGARLGRPALRVA